MSSVVGSQANLRGVSPTEETLRKRILQLREGAARSKLAVIKIVGSVLVLCEVWSGGFRRMTGSLDLWIEYMIRFSHLLAGIAWIGSSFYFIWLDSSFETPKVARKNVEGEVFMVHGGFYYQVEKRKIFPGELPDNLHWFKWEATLTWVTGILLLGWLYYLKGASLLMGDHPVINSQWLTVGSSVLLIVASWFIYDFIFHPDRAKNKNLSLALAILYFSALIYLYFTVFSGRGAFIQTGATFGSLMLFNVWVRILPGQKKMIDEATRGEAPDYSVSLKSKTRSVHNTYFTFPVLFIMLSNHYPQLYNHSMNWLLLVLLAVSGALVRHAMVTKVNWHRWALVPAAAGLAALVVITAQKPKAKAQVALSGPTAKAQVTLSGPTAKAQVTLSGPTADNGSVAFAQVHAILTTHCQSCHSQTPTDEVFREAPKGLILETEDQLWAAKEKVLLQVVEGKVMPLGNKTRMTDEEREVIRAYLMRGRSL